MTKFYLIDHSLKQLGGHHYEYALHVLNAAERAGREPILAANRRFAQVTQVPDSWKIISPYRYSTYSRHSLMGNLAKWLGREDAREEQTSWLQRQRQRLTKAVWQASEWRRLIRGNVRSKSFTRGTKKLFQEYPLSAGDQVLVATANELDLIGALRVWEADPNTALAEWHFQFHFNIEPDWQVDARLRDYHQGRIRDLFGRCREDFPTHRLQFHTTTEQLAEQYNHLGTAAFHWLPYPVNPRFGSAKVPHQAEQPLRVTCIGGVREEKGIGVLPTLLRAVWSDLFESGKAQLALQAKSEDELPTELRSLWNAAEASRLRQIKAGTDQPQTPISLIPFPLDTEGYHRLVVESDIGLLLYDRRQYQARCSGVLVELLSAGVPVLVPAGCWLADQIAEEVSRHQETLPERMTKLGGEIHSGREGTPGRSECSERHGGRSLQIPPGATHLLLAISWQVADDRSGYCRVQVRQLDATGREVGRSVEILSPRQNGLASTALVSLQPNCARMEWECHAAFQDQPLEISEFGAQFMAPRTPGATIPLGAVGLIFSDAAQTPDLLRNLVEHYPHYERTAAAFARRFFAEHSPDHVVAELMSRDSGAESRRAA